MALNKNNLLSLIATNLPDNTTGAITPSLLRQVLEQMVTADANLEESLGQVFNGDISYPNQGTVGYTNSGTFVSAITQTGVSDVGTTVTFGGGGNTSGNNATVGADGIVTINTDSYFSIKQRFRTGRIGASGVSELFFWAEMSIDNGATWVEIGNSVDVSLANSDATVVFFDISNMFFVAGVKLRNRFARSSTGNDSGDLIPASPSAALALLGVPDAPSAQITIYRIEQ